MLKRIIAMALVVLMIVALAGCGKEKREIIVLTLSSEDSEAILNAAGIHLPDENETAAAGSHVKYYSWNDDLNNYSEAEIIQTGYWTFKEKYGCTAEWIECVWGSRFDTLANLILSGEAPDLFPAASNTFPAQPLRGVFQPVDDYIDYDDPLWSGTKDFTDKFFSIKGKRYCFTTDVSFDEVVAYNRRVINEYGYTDPAELYLNDEWNWDVFTEMCIDFSDSDEDRYALDNWGYQLGLMRSCGVLTITYDPETSTFTNNVDDPRIERAANMMYELARNDCMYNLSHGSIRNGTEGAGMAEGKLLFCVRGAWVFTGTLDVIEPIFGDVAEELMFVPLPRDPQGDGYYYTETTPIGYCLVNNAPNPEGAALLAACDRFKVVDPTVVRIDRQQLKDKYHWTDEMLDMWDECYKIANERIAMVPYDAGYGTQLARLFDNCESGSRQTSWAQIKEANRDSLTFYCDDLNDQIAKFDPNTADVTG